MKFLNDILDNADAFEHIPELARETFEAGKPRYQEQPGKASTILIGLGEMFLTHYREHGSDTIERNNIRLFYELLFGHYAAYSQEWLTKKNGGVKRDEWVWYFDSAVQTIAKYTDRILFGTDGQTLPANDDSIDYDMSDWSYKKPHRAVEMTIFYHNDGAVDVFVSMHHFKKVGVDPASKEDLLAREMIHEKIFGDGREN